MNKRFSRRDFLKLAGGAAATVAGASLLPQFLRRTLMPDEVVRAAGDYDLFFAGTDGWMWNPGPAQPPYHPDVLAEPPFTNYMFGFRDVTHYVDSVGSTAEQKVQNQKMKTQHNAPFFWVNQVDPDSSTPADFKLQITNLGLQIRPDLTDPHTLHWHGFRNVIPFFDGEPTGSVAVPTGGFFTYVYRPRDPGTYMYHCHVEDVEHVHMGMTGIVFVRPWQNQGPSIGGYSKFAYNDGDGSTGYDREFPMFLSEVWLKARWNGAHIQEHLWADFKADFSLLNGRVYPDTLLPNSPIDVAASTTSPGHSLVIQTDADSGDLIPNSGLERLQYQPHSALVTCEENERVLLRFANLGFREAAMTLAGLKMRVVGRDATPMRGRSPDGGVTPGVDTSYYTDTILIGAGESFDVIIEAPAYDPIADVNSDGYNTYVLYNRRYTQVSNLSAGGAAGQRTEVRVYPTTALGPQAHFNDAVLY
jgi:FtsP/CotA-like multicopper oxidase with cupredoxin domain